MTSPSQRKSGTTAERRDLERWLEAEGAGAERDAEAEKALATLFLRVERLEPKPGFAERVLGELRPERVAVAQFRPAAGQPVGQPVGQPTGQARPWRRWLGVGLAALVPLWLLVGAMAPSLLAPARRLVSVAEILDGIGQGLDWAARALTGLGDVWSAFSGVAQAMATATGTLPLAALLLVGLGIAGLALRALSDLMARERSWSHVHFGT